MLQSPEATQDPQMDTATVGESGTSAPAAQKTVAVVLDAWDHSYNGTVVSTRRFIEQLSSGRYRFEILASGATAPNKWTFPTLKIPGINRIIERMRSPLSHPDKKQIALALEHADILHIAYPFFLGAAAIKQARNQGIPIVSCFHVQPENMALNLGIRSERVNAWIYKLFIRHFYNSADLVISPSEFGKQLLIQHGLTTPCHVVSNGIPEDFFWQPPQEKFQRSSKNRPFKLLSVGRLAKEKNQRLIIEALAQSAFKDQIDIQFVGVGPMEDKLKKLAAEKLPGRCQISEVENIQLRSLYREADLFIHASEIELEGMSVMEAMAHGLPVIVADSSTSAAPSFVNPESLFKFPEVASLTQSIDYFLGSEQARQRASADNLQRAGQRQHKKSIELMDRIYQDAITQFTRRQ